VETLWRCCLVIIHHVHKSGLFYVPMLFSLLLYYTFFYVSPFHALLHISHHLVSHLSSLSFIHHCVWIFKTIPLSLTYYYILTTVSLISQIFSYRFDTFRSSFWSMILNHCFYILTHWFHETTIHGLVVPSQSVLHSWFWPSSSDVSHQVIVNATHALTADTLHPAEMCGGRSSLDQWGITVKVTTAVNGWSRELW
jgi:hypothetical protein